MVKTNELFDKIRVFVVCFEPNQHAEWVKG
jgi:hypothetical protein